MNNFNSMKGVWGKGKKGYDEEHSASVARTMDKFEKMTMEKASMTMTKKRDCQPPASNSP